MSTEQPTIDHLKKMMEFCNDYSFVIPSYNLNLPPEASGVNYRPEKIFRLLRSGFMSYSGTGFSSTKGKLSDINVGGIPLTQQWIDRAYIFLSAKVKEKTKAKAGACKIKYIDQLLLRFGGCEFLQTN